MKKLLEIKQISKKFQVGKEEIQILKNINLEISSNEFVSIVGHSGCGKSTLLKMIAGLVEGYEGEILLDGEKIGKPDRRRGLLFQNHRLLPWLTVEQNIGLGLDHMEQEEKREKIREQLSLVQLEGFEKAYPNQLSGGMAHRVAIARSLVTEPEILLMDEPFGALDALTRITMQQELLSIWEKKKNTMILVTHDIDEAVFLGGTIIIMSQRPGTIADVIHSELPRNRDRNSPEFQEVKRRIYRHFFKDLKMDIEYYI
jgi:sulfonate transport system ATP-binding protein